MSLVSVRTSLAVDLASVSDLHHVDTQSGIVNTIDNAIVALPDAIALRFA